MTKSHARDGVSQEHIPHAQGLRAQAALYSSIMTAECGWHHNSVLKHAAMPLSDMHSAHKLQLTGAVALQGGRVF